MRCAGPAAVLLGLLRASSGFAPPGLSTRRPRFNHNPRPPWPARIDARPLQHHGRHGVKFARVIGGSRLGMSDGAESAPAPPRRGLTEKLLSRLPPACERKKLFPLALMFFFILFNYTILRSTKDVLMVTASGAEVIPFIKTYVNLPLAVGFTAAYSRLCDRLEQREVFYCCVLPFLAFFPSFAFLVFPNVGRLHPHAFFDNLAPNFPPGFAAPLAIFRNWSFALFYVMAEMWGTVVASLLFWSFANEVFTVEEAKKYYPLLGLGANVALILSGQYVRLVSKLRFRDNLPPGVDPWGLSLKYLMGAVTVCGGCLLSLFSYMQRKVVTDPECVDQERRRAAKEKKVMGVRDSAKFLMGSTYMRDLATLVISYGMCINLTDVSWKSKLKLAYPDPSAYSGFMGNFASVTGSVTLVAMLLGRKVFKYFGWRNAAMVTPSVIGVTGLAFYALTLFAPFFGPVARSLGTTPVMLAVVVGAAQNILSKSSKYSLFDPCKEMAYIPLDRDSRTKGKAAVDVVGNPLGDSGGSLVQQALIFGVGSIAAATPYLAGILGLVLFFWFRAVNSLAGQFEAAVEASGEAP